jgi:hypothetical protein
MKNNDKPFPIRLGEIKPILQQEAVDNDRSLHYWIKKILNDYVKIKKPS